MVSWISLLVSTLCLQAIRAYPGHLIKLPDPAKDTSLKKIPDGSHYYKAPGPDDQRGPCPGLNTMANHGYIPRNGIASYAEIVNGAQEVFNMGYDLASALTSFAMLARGNAFTNQLSIGGESRLIPPLPGKIDGPIVLGLAHHGRFEGDVSMTRQDAAIGDNRNFQGDLYEALLDVVHQYGDDSPVTGNKTIVNTRVMQEFKYQRFLTDQKINPHLEYGIGRLLLSYGEAAFTLNFFANGTDGILTIATMTSFFKNQTFPENWHRRSSAASFRAISNHTGEIYSAHPISPGINAPNGTYIPQGDVESSPCLLYTNMGRDNLPATLMTTTGLFRKNVDTLLGVLYAPFSEVCNMTYPDGPSGV